jgi:two-component system, chemotaxis family, protein-glutamate methylesterase/glutaminase
LTATNGAVRVLICDDSATYATGLARLLGRGREIEVVGICPTAEEALRALPRLQPDLLTMDLHLPGMSGLEAVEQVMGTSPLPILVISSRIASRDSTLVATALAAGALDALSKSELDGVDPAGPSGTALRRRVKLLSHARVIRHPRASVAARAPQPARRPARPCAAIAIVASTGGPPALARVLRTLPATYPIPVLVVQHIAPGFVEGFAKWLGSEIPLPVKLARDGGALERGVWIAPEGAHLVLRPELRFLLDRSESTHAHRPSGDVLLRSVAKALGPEAAGVVLTGMGRDGAAGLAAIRAAGGSTFAQDEETSAVYGMPKIAAESAEAIVPVDEIGQRLALLRPPEALR